MEVALIRYTEDPYSVVYFAGKSCVVKDLLFQDVVENVPLEEKEKFIRKLVQAGHESVLEHVTYTFSISGISRVATHQLVRHRLASYSQFSHRRFDGYISYITPEAFSQVPDPLKKRLRTFLFTATQLYKDLVDSGVEEDIARYVLPQALSTHIVATFNARSLRNFFRLRMSEEASWEIREVATRMFDLVYSITPAFFFDLSEARQKVANIV